MKLWSWERWRITSPACFQGVAPLSSVFRNGRVKVNVEDLDEYFPKVRFYKYEAHPPPPWIYGEQARQPKFCQRRGLNSPEGWFWLLPVVLVKLRGRKGFFRSSCRSLCLWVALMPHVVLVSENIIYFTADWKLKIWHIWVVLSVGIYADHSLHRSF